MVAAVVVHHGEQRDLVLRRGPHHAWRVHEVAVTLDVDREAAEIAVGESGTDRRRDAITDAIAAGVPQPMVVLLHRPEPMRPIADVAGLSDQRPVEILDLAPDFHRQSSCADRTCVPGERRRLAGPSLRLGTSLLGGFAAL